MKNRKKIGGLLLALALTVSMIPQTALAEGTTEQASTGYQTEEQTDAAQTEETTDAAQEQDGTDKTSVETSDSSDGESAETENGSVSVSESTDISDHGADFRSGEKANEPGESYPAVSFNTKADDGTEIEADTVIIATGASAKYLGLDDERKYNGQGVSACATCDGFFYRKKTVAVVGGGDTACEDALYLAGLCKKVYLIVRKPFLRASQVMQQRVKDNENIEILFEHNTLGLYGENGVEGAHLVKRKGEADEEMVDIAIDGFFLAIGHKPNTDIFKDWLDMDETGYLKKIDGTPKTKIPGVFVAGDCADPVYRQAISAAGSGCQAAIEAERFLLNR